MSDKKSRGIAISLIVKFYRWNDADHFDFLWNSHQNVFL